MLAVAAQLQLPPRVLPSIQAVEGGRVGLVRTNRNGSEDFGLMQINSIWLEPLSRRTGLTREILRSRLIDDACFNIAVAGAVLRVYLRETNGNLLAAIGNYHSHTPARHSAYQLKVIGAAVEMFVNRSTQHVAAGAR